MQNGAATNQIKDYLKNNWFKLSLAFLLVFIILRKDMSFQLNLKAPARQETPEQRNKRPVEQKKKKAEQETYTDNTLREQDQLTGKSSVMDYFKFPSIGGGSNTVSKAFTEFSKVDEANKRAFMKRFAHVAVSEREKFGIPAAIIIANGLLHSHSGQRDMARAGNNYFALPCTDDWQGASGNYQGSCYRHYENAWSSFRDHSLYISTGAFAQLLQMGSSDYKGWARALEKAAFSEEPDLAGNLIRIIESYRLYELDE